MKNPNGFQILLVGLGLLLMLGLLLSFGFASAGWGMMGPGMMGGGWRGGWGLPGWIGGIVLVGFVVLAVVAITRSRPVSDRLGGSPNPSPREILETRYARGEITREQFEQMKADLSR